MSSRPTTARSTGPRSTARSGGRGREGGDEGAAEKGERCGLIPAALGVETTSQGQSLSTR